MQPKNPLIQFQVSDTASAIASYLGFLDCCASQDLSNSAMTEGQVYGLSLALRVAVDAAQFIADGHELAPAETDT